MIINMILGIVVSIITIIAFITVLSLFKSLLSDYNKKDDDDDDAGDYVITQV